ncbi:MAG: hypothetical protein CM1200mP22_33200 [Dehalococcoidia bacterium]|nr:MAG: hypothetical protein CM1200mP22_33200 [Dehalococcoidia bacterium]
MVCFSLIAKDRVMPGTDAKSSTAASLMPFSVPNRLIKSACVWDLFQTRCLLET